MPQVIYTVVELGPTVTLEPPDAPEQRVAQKDGRDNTIVSQMLVNTTTVMNTNARVVG